MSRAKIILVIYFFAASSLTGCKLTAAPENTPTADYIEIIPTPSFAFPSQADNSANGNQNIINEPTPTNPAAAGSSQAAPVETSPAAVPVLPTPAAALSSPAASVYVDDRSTPAQVVISYYNALNRSEILRAYSYWSYPENSIGSLDAFSASLGSDLQTELTFGPITAGAGAGQVYYAVPVLVRPGNSISSLTSACYLVHQSQPSFFGSPPFIPMGIVSVTETPLPAGTNENEALATACAGAPGGGITIPAESAALEIAPDNYLDNRSGPLETVASFLNALNLKQYVRAYSYMDDPEHFPGSFTEFETGYAETELITATFGTALNEGAMGSLYYKQPLGMQVKTSSGDMQYFVGCYTLRLGQPSVQSEPPFRPLGITGGSFKAVDSQTAIQAGLPNTCK